MPLTTYTSTTSASSSNTSRMYRGGFTTSICDMFGSSREKSDCCALACCGLLLSDKTGFLLTGQEPSWWFRLWVNVGLPVGYLFGMALMSSLFDTPQAREGWARLTLIGFIVIVTLLLIRARSERVKMRRNVMARMYEERYRDSTQGRATLDTYLRTHDGDTRLVHSMCCCCYPQDLMYNTTGAPVDSQQNDDLESKNGDFCTWLWNVLGALCCLTCCGSWCMCCGMCATGQEYREVIKFEQEGQQKVDYVTFEPYQDYYANILRLRTQGVSSFWAHLGALSQLSRKLLRLLGMALLLLFVISVSGINGDFTPLNLLVVLATFFQAFFVLYLVHWKWHKLTLSLDAVIKYFSSGFILCTGLAIIYELLISMVFGILFEVVIIVGVGIEISHHDSAGDGDDDGASSNHADDMKKYMLEFAKEYPWIWGILIFLNAFVVAALVEELCKYFSFWMVEHPDLEGVDNQQGIHVATAGSASNDGTYLDIDAQDNGENQQHLPLLASENGSGMGQGDEVADAREEAATDSLQRGRTLDSLGAAITVAMVATALGFACCENLLYVFIYTPPTIANEITTLVVRSLFPVHPLAAAIQSIGVCQRDLEGRADIGIGKIILPAWLLHGSFDFILMLVAFLSSLYGVNEDDGADNNDDATANAQENSMGKSEMMSLIVASSTVLFGVAYYILMSITQTRRLVGLGRTLQQQQQSQTPPTV